MKTTSVWSVVNTTCLKMQSGISRLPCYAICDANRLKLLFSLAYFWIHGFWCLYDTVIEFSWLFSFHLASSCLVRESFFLKIIFTKQFTKFGRKNTHNKKVILRFSLSGVNGYWNEFSSCQYLYIIALNWNSIISNKSNHLETASWNINVIKMYLFVWMCCIQISMS